MYVCRVAFGFLPLHFVSNFFAKDNAEEMRCAVEALQLTTNLRNCKSIYKILKGYWASGVARFWVKESERE